MADVVEPLVEPLNVQIKRWPDREARFLLSRPTRRMPLSFGISLSELREIAALAAAAEQLLAEQPHTDFYTTGDLKQITKARAAA